MPPKTMREYLAHRFSRFDGREAFIHKTRYRTLSYSYKELLILVNKTAHFLQQKGLKAGDRILIYSYNCPQWSVLFLACALSGIVVVPIDFSSPPSFARLIRGKTKAKGVFCSFIKPLPHKSAYFLEDLFLDIKECPDKFKSPLLGEDDLFEIVYTSGTTGDPKGVMITQKNIISDMLAMTQAAQIPHNTKFLSILPLSHLFEQTVGLLVPLFFGSTIVYSTSLKPTALLRAFQEERISMMVTVPIFLQSLRDSILKGLERESKLDLFLRLQSFARNAPSFLKRLFFWRIHERLGGSFHSFIVGGAPLDMNVELFWESLGVQVLQGYGLTETSPVISCNTFTAKKSHTVGRVLPGVFVKISDEGEILVKGPTVTRGYYQDAEKTLHSFVRGWYKTGDMGCFDKEGYLLLKGRKKNMILSGSGLNVYPEDIESVLLEQPEVKDCCVLGIERKGNTSITAAIVLKAPLRKTPFLERVNKKLASHQRIHDLVLWEGVDFPRTTSFKIKRQEVLDRVTNQKIASVSVSKSSTKLQKILEQITHQQLHKITSRAVLARDLHLDSLQRVELLSALEEEYGIQLEESSITDKTTVNGLEKMLQRAEKINKKSFIQRWQLSPFFVYLRLFLQPFFFIVIRFFTPLQIKGKENLALLNTPGIFVCNHTSHLDTPIFLRALPPRFRMNIAVAAAEDYFFTNWFYSLLNRLFLNAYPFSRKSNIRRSFEATGTLLNEGYSILIYPEGTRTTTGRMNPFKVGIGLLAHQMDVPIIPVKIEGLYHVLPKNKKLPRRFPVIMRLGKPLIMKHTESHLALAKTIEQEVNKL